MPGTPLYRALDPISTLFRVQAKQIVDFGIPDPLFFLVFLFFPFPFSHGLVYIGTIFFSVHFGKK